MNNRKQISKYIFRIPLIIMIDVVVFTVCLFIDGSATSGDQLGHPAPYLSLIVGSILAIVTLFTIIQSLYKVISLVIHKDEDGYKTARTRKKIHPIVPILSSFVISAILVLSLGTYEINRFYADPNHIGFAFPIATFFLAIICLVVCFVVSIFSIWLYKRK